MSNTKIKNLRFEITIAQYAKFWSIVDRLGESEKGPAFVKILEKLDKIL